MEIVQVPTVGRGWGLGMGQGRCQVQAGSHQYQ